MNEAEYAIWSGKQRDPRESESRLQRNERRVAILSQHGLSIEDALSASNFIRAHTNHEPTFEECVDFCRGLKARYPFHSASEAFEAGLVGLETGYHERPELADLPEMAEWIFDGIKDG